MLKRYSNKFEITSLYMFFLGSLLKGLVLIPCKTASDPLFQERVGAAGDGDDDVWCANQNSPRLNMGNATVPQREIGKLS